jgi:hypothetical protein
MASHVPLDFIDAVREGFVAALGPNSKIRELERRDLLPCSVAQRVQIVSGAALNRTSYREVSYAQYSFQAFDYHFQGRIQVEL